MSAQQPVSAAGEGAAGKAACPSACPLHQDRGRGARGGDQASRRREGSGKTGQPAGVKWLF